MGLAAGPGHHLERRSVRAEPLPERVELVPDARGAVVVPEDGQALVQARERPEAHERGVGGVAHQAEERRGLLGACLLYTSDAADE